MKLSDSQLVILNKAGQRADRAVTVPDGYNAGVKAKVITPLIKAGLLTETKAEDGMPAWRSDHAKGRLALVVTDRGLAALDGGEAPPKPAKGAKGKAAGKQRIARKDTKQAKIIDMLKRERGTSLNEICKATGWLPHSTRAFLSATLRKKLKLNVETERTDSGSYYRIK